MGEKPTGQGMGPLLVVDADVFIDHLRGVEAATTYLRGIPREQRATTDVSVMELLRGATNKRQTDAIGCFLLHNRFVSLPVTTAASRRAVVLVRRYALSHGMKLPDALVAAICMEPERRLVTRNLRHFEYLPGLAVQKPPYAQASSAAREDSND